MSKLPPDKRLILDTKPRFRYSTLLPNRWEYGYWAGGTWRCIKSFDPNMKLEECKKELERSTG